MTLKTKFILIKVTTGIMILITGILSISSGYSIKQSSNHRQVLNEINQASSQQQKELTNYIVFRDENYLLGLIDNNQKMDDLLDLMIRNDGYVNEIKQARSVNADIFFELDQLSNYLNATETSLTDIQTISPTMKTGLNRLQLLIGEFDVRIAQLRFTNNQLLLRSISRFYASIIIFVFLSFITYIISVAVFLKLLAFTKKIKKTISDFSDGDFSQKIDIKTDDEFGSIGAELNSMVERINQSFKILQSEALCIKSQNEQSNLQVKTILNNIKEGLVVINEDREVVLVNNEACSLLSCEESELIGNKWPEIAQPNNQSIQEVENYPSVRSIISAEVLKSGLSDGVMYQGNNPEAFAVHVTSAPLIMDGTVVGAVIVFRDITEDVRIDTAKTEFVSLASHQLRTPLSAINWYAEVLTDEIKKDGGGKKQWLDYIKNIEHSSHRMVTLVNGLLNVSRIETDRVLVNPEEINLVDIIDSVVDDLAEQYSERKIKVKKIYQKDIGLIINDPALIKIIATNLISNAIKYSPAESQIDIVLKKNEVGEIIFSVKDRGCGIPVEQQTEIFKKMFRADNAKAIDTDGNGLGLYIVKSIIEKIGGTISFNSRVNQGATFTVVFPIKIKANPKGVKSLINI